MPQGAALSAPDAGARIVMQPDRTDHYHRDAQILDRTELLIEGDNADTRSDDANAAQMA